MNDPIAGSSPSGVRSIARTVRVREMDLPLRVARNLISGAVQRDMVARSPTVQVGTWELGPWTTVASAPIGNVGGHFPVPSDGPIEVVSTSAADTLVGAGLQTLTVSGVAPGGATATSGNLNDAPWQVDILTMNGITPVQSSLSFAGGLVRAARTATAGTSWTNLGTITITRVADGRVLHVIPPQWGSTKNEWFTVPLGWIAVVRRIVPYWSGDVQCRWRLREHLPDPVNKDLGVRKSDLGGALQVENSGPELDLSGGKVIPGGTTFWFEAQRDPGGAGTANILTMYADVEFYLGNDAALAL